MGLPANISGSIIEALYSEALVLADEVRATFQLRPPSLGEDADNPMRIALSTEGLRTTTRMMHILAWLLNHRAHFAGDLSEFQLRRHGALPEDREPNLELLALLEEPTCQLIAETRAIHGRIDRLDRAWRDRFEMQPAAILRLRERLGFAVASDARRHRIQDQTRARDQTRA